jgi:predicted nucleic acid-binding protein
VIICLDASVVVNWLLPEADSDEDSFDALLAGADQIVAPPLLFAETTSVLARFAYLGRLDYEEVSDALRNLFSVAISLSHQLDVCQRAVEIARELGHKRAYDAQYLAVAELAGATLVTSDGPMYSSATRLSISASLV